MSKKMKNICDYYYWRNSNNGFKHYVMGVDIGSHSIGICLIAYDDQGRYCGLLDWEVKTFTPGIANGHNCTPAQIARMKRHQRRGRDRLKKRKNKLARLLIDNGMLPEKQIELKDFFKINPYVLRRRALSERLTLFEIGRILYHINQRRGFLSSRKSGNAKKEGPILKEISALQAEINDSPYETLGEYFAAMLERDRYRNKIRTKHTSRSMYRDEIQTIWEHQSQYHPDILTDDLCRQIQDETILYQRALRDCSHLIGNCELDPKEKRCSRNDRIAQCFRVMQDVNNMQIEDENGVMQSLTIEQKQIVSQYLLKRKSVPFKKIKSLLQTVEERHINLEGNDNKKKKTLMGNVTESEMGKSTLFGSTWWKMSTEERDIKIDQINQAYDDDELREIAKEWGLSDEQINTLVKVEFPSGYMNFSRKTMETILPFLTEGQQLTEAVSSAGYLHPWERNVKTRSQVLLPTDIKNPTVNKSLQQAAEIVNRFIRMYGMPERITVELARDMKMSKETKKRLGNQQTVREERKQKIKTWFQKRFGVRAAPSDVARVIFWEDGNQICPYTGRDIPEKLLAPGCTDLQIDHLLPYSRSIDNHMANKVLCYSYANAEKDNRTPYEWYGQDESRWNEFLQWVKNIQGADAYARRKKCLQKTVSLEDAIGSYLADTQYASRETVRMLKQLGVPVVCCKGYHTAVLRSNLDLNKLLGNNKSKNRLDMRHHAIDALVIAMMDHSMLVKLAKYRRSDDTSVWPIWDNFGQEIADKFSQLIVQTCPENKIKDDPFNETLYGHTDIPGQYVVSKELSKLTRSMIIAIRDKTIRKIVQRRLKQAGLDIKNLPKKLPPDILKHLTMPSGIPIKKVKIIVKSQHMSSLPVKGSDKPRYQLPEKNHHIEIYAIDDKKTIVKSEVVSVAEARRRSKAKICVSKSEQDYQQEGKRLICSLMIDDLVEMDNGIYRVQKMEKLGTVVFRPHWLGGSEPMKDETGGNYLQTLSPTAFASRFVAKLV